MLQISVSTLIFLCFVIINVESVAVTRTLLFNWIYPGTKWCGVGNVSDHFEDFGPERDTDNCCRIHDSCPDFLLPGEKGFHLTNDAWYARLSCECDDEMRKCLRAVQQKHKSTSARNIGYIYFNFIRRKCFRMDYPVVRCVKKRGIIWLTEKCLEYEYDTTSNKQYQWFDVGDF